MSRGAKASALALAVGLTLLGYAARPDARVYGETSFGRTPQGFGALYDLLVELERPVARSYVPADRLPEEATVWWIRPEGLCASAEGAASDAEPGASAEPGAALVGWAERGGTAVVFLGAGACSRLGGLRIPEREGPACGGDEEQGDTRAGDECPPEGPRETAAGAGEPASRRLEGPMLPAPRTLETRSLRVFRGGEANWRTLAATREGAPLVLERPVGAGRVVVAADARFLRNRGLGRADAALLAYDFVRAFGAPRLDERRHGLRPHRSGALYLLRSPAVLLFLGLALLGLAYAWRGAALPPREGEAREPEPPSLDAFVDSLASLYARSRDYDGVLEHYRELTALRLRRSLGLPVETPRSALVERLRRSARAPEARIRLLAEGRSLRRESELRAAVHELDTLLQEVAA